MPYACVWQARKTESDHGNVKMRYHQRPLQNTSEFRHGFTQKRWSFRHIAARLNMFRCDQYNLSVTQIYLTFNENASRASKSRKLVQMPVTLINTFVHFNDIIWTLRSFCLSLFSPPSISHPHKMKFCAQTS